MVYVVWKKYVSLSDGDGREFDGAKVHVSVNSNKLSCYDALTIIEPCLFLNRVSCVCMNHLLCFRL